MATQITVRLPDELGKSISGIAKRLHLKRSAIVRMALEKFIKGVGSHEEGAPFDLVKDLIGSIDTGLPDLGESHRKYLTERIRKNA